MIKSNDHLKSIIISGEEMLEKRGDMNTVMHYGVTKLQHLIEYQTIS